MAKKDFQKIARFYNSVYCDKNYGKEVDELITYIPVAFKNILDVGCGTGNHSWPLYYKGYNVVGIDPSIEMLRIAKSQLPKGLYISNSNGSGIKFLEYAVQDFCPIGYRAYFDVVVAMFDVFDYVLSSSDFRKSLQNVWKCLIEKGLFFIEGWNKDRVSKVYEPYKVKKFIFNGTECIRQTLTVWQGDLFKVSFTYHVSGKTYQELHTLHPRFGEKNNWVKDHGFEIVEQKTDDYSVKLWLKKEVHSERKK